MKFGQRYINIDQSNDIFFPTPKLGSHSRVPLSREGVAKAEAANKIPEQEPEISLADLRTAKPTDSIYEVLHKPIQSGERRRHRHRHRRHREPHRPKSSARRPLASKRFKTGKEGAMRSRKRGKEPHQR